MDLHITKATIVRIGGPDVVYLTTGLPEAIWPYTDELDLRFYCASGKAEAYLEKHFPGVPVEVIKGPKR